MTLRSALREIVNLPSEHDLQLNAAARAMHTIARDALAATEGYEECQECGDHIIRLDTAATDEQIERSFDAYR